MATKFFAAIDGSGNVSGAIYGIGRTEDEAVADALSAASDGDYTAVPMTEDAYRYVERFGGLPDHRLIVGRHGVELDGDIEPDCGTLMDSDTADEIGPATREQRDASRAAGPEGHILIDDAGDVVAERGEGVRRVYVFEG